MPLLLSLSLVSYFMILILKYFPRKKFLRWTVADFFYVLFGFVVLCVYIFHNIKFSEWYHHWILYCRSCGFVVGWQPRFFTGILRLVWCVALVILQNACIAPSSQHEAKESNLQQKFIDRNMSGWILLVSREACQWNS